MGYRNVDRALMADAEPVAAHLLLVAMAATTKDGTARYYGGMEWLIAVMHTDRRRVYRLLTALSDDGWIKPDGYEHGRRVWVLNLPGPDVTPGQAGTGG
jgi:hypothetical protein